MGTGTLVARRALLTAGHNLAGTVETHWAIDPAYNQIPRFAPLRTRRSIPHPRWLTASDPLYDIGVILLEDEARNWITPTIFKENDRGSKIYVSGYSLDDPNFQRFDLGQFSGESANIAGHTCDTAPGQSGSPVIAYDEQGSKLLGVHVYGHSELSDLIAGPVNKAVMLVPEIFEWLENVLEEGE